MDSNVTGKLGMESCYQMLALFHQHRVAIVAGQHPGSLAHPANDGGAYEYGLEVFVAQAAGFWRNLDDTAVELTPVAVSLHSDVEKIERFLLRMRDLRCQKDSAGAGSEHRLVPPEFAQRLLHP